MLEKIRNLLLGNDYLSSISGAGTNREVPTLTFYCCARASQLFTRTR